MSKLKSVFIFIAGASIGAAAAWYVTKEKYETILDKEIASVKETYKKKAEIKVDVPSEEDIYKTYDNPYDDVSSEIKKKDKVEFDKIVNDNGYVNYTQYMDKDKQPDELLHHDDIDPSAYIDIPYVIDPEQYGEDGYDVQTLTYYADNVLVDDIDTVIDDQDGYVGLENLKVFEEFGASSVMVRNETLRVDFEIMKDDWKFSDFTMDDAKPEHLEEGRKNRNARLARENKPHNV